MWPCMSSVTAAGTGHHRPGHGRREDRLPSHPRQGGHHPDFDGHARCRTLPAPEVYHRRGLMIAEINGQAEGARCLTCDDICEICTEVCPNRANVAIVVPDMTTRGRSSTSTGLCNECGNCGTFCPHAGLPYMDKITVFWTREDFDISTDIGFPRCPTAAI